ncbi:putative Quinate permease [Glarea lozoyensis 74030]|uniref:Putative Quinate permease n=1 Tax=Glarea lozoyensis (strain ATCC 74030 / MF5533) TaxID=1104152 RepID=H0EPK0_GLAL7|nr:putative Quinate permease [Glarea lozoyensis 74030]
MYWAVDKFGRVNLLICGSVVAAFAMWFIGAYIKICPPATSAHISAGGYAAATMIYVFAIAFCFSWAGIPWIYCSEIFPYV